MQNEIKNDGPFYLCLSFKLYKLCSRGEAATQIASPAKNQSESEKMSWQFIPMPTASGLVLSAFKSF